jgi:hypothetical protein
MCALPLWIYINLKKELGQKMAFEIMRAAILTGGVAQWISPITPPRKIAPSRISTTIPRTYDGHGDSRVDAGYLPGR